MFFALAGYTLTLISVIFSFLDKKLTTILIGAVVIIFGIVSLFFINKKKFKELEEHYKDEKHRKLKGWLVFAWVISSIALFAVSLVVFDV